MKIQCTREYYEKIQQNEFLKKAVVQYIESFENGKHVDFMDSNPDLIQMIMHWASSDEIKVLEE